MFKLEGDKVIGLRGDVLAEKIYGQWQTKDAAVLEFLENQGNTEEKIMVRARNSNGHFIADDPDTEVNEAWVVKTTKKIAGKK